MLRIYGYQVGWNNRYVTKIQRQTSSTKFYSVINQNTEISNKNTNSYLNLYKTIPVIKLEEQNSWSQDDILKSSLSIMILKSNVPPNMPS